MKRLEHLPVPILPTFVGTLTLSNVYAGIGYSFIRHLMMWIAAALLICYILKLIRFFPICRQEYKTTVPCSLYAGFTMLMMILGSYFFEFYPFLGKGLWSIGLILHAIHIVVFSIRSLIIRRNIQTFVPSWFVTYNGIMVSCVVGSAMQADSVLRIVVYYGIIIYFVLIPFIIWRLIKVELKPQFYHTMAIVLAPCSLCVVSYLNIIPNPNPILLTILYLCVLASLAFVIYKLPKFFSFPFSPSFAGMTFPMAIGIVASTKMSAYVLAAGQETLSNVIGQLAGIQIILTTMIIGYVLLRFLMMLFKVSMQSDI